MPLTHTDAIAQVIQAIQAAGGRAVKRDDGLVYDRNGRRRRRLSGPADVYGVVPPQGRHVEVEVKVGADRWRDDQRAWARTMAGLGARVVLARWHHRPVGDEADVLAEIGGTLLLLHQGDDHRLLVEEITS
ncbi:MAG: hypothetical protein GVY33_02035 [Alphaproteobacteria bacterium]|jgi:hypothetical protein|nr:hypothetical protein [Alphaproteobacteria bacterium]